uniref:Protein TsetseEP domain-containing protein n=1 Tax=Graphocephala atropunctata TaxID=36148 RepID=A0A1B6K9L1_9HEMI
MYNVHVDILTMAFAATFVLAAIAIPAIYQQVLVSGQEVESTTCYQYYTMEAEAADRALWKKLVYYDKSFGKYMQNAKGYSNSSQAVRDYECLVDSVEGTKCAISTDERKFLTDTQEELDDAIDICGSFYVQCSRANIRAMIEEKKTALQKYDSDYKFTSIACFSLRVPESESCKESKRKSMKSINNVATSDELAKLDELVNKALYEAKTEIDACITCRTTALIQSLESRTTNLEICQTYYKITKN